MSGPEVDEHAPVSPKREADRQIRIDITPEPTEEERIALLLALDARDASADNQGFSDSIDSTWTRLGRGGSLRVAQWPLQIHSWSQRRL